jgi:hypothetical protein
VAQPENFLPGGNRPVRRPGFPSAVSADHSKPPKLSSCLGGNAGRGGFGGSSHPVT